MPRVPGAAQRAAKRNGALQNRDPGCKAMLDHIGFPVSDYARAKTFYLKALAPLGYTLVMEMEQEVEKGLEAAGLS